MTSKTQGAPAVILRDQLMCTAKIVVSIYPSHRSAKLMPLLTLWMNLNSFVN